MKQAIVIVGFILVLSGCISISVPNSPNPRFYMLESVNKDQGIKKINLPSSVFISVGPVKIPQDQDRPQIVTIAKDKALNFAQFDRWGEPLDLGVSRLIREDLAVIMPQGKFILYPWNSQLTVKYQITVEIIQLDSELNGDLALVAQWVITDAQSGKPVMVKRSQFSQAIVPQDYFGLAKTLSAACVSVSSDIAEALAALPPPPAPKTNP